MHRLLPIAIACLLLAPLHAAEPPVEPEQQLEPAGAEDAAQPEEQAPEDTAEPDEDGTDSRVPLREIHRYVAVYNAIKEAYVDPVVDAELMQSAIRGLLLDLDPHSAYLSGDDARAFDESTTGAYAGIGVEVVRMPDGSMRVVAPIDDDPRRARRPALRRHHHRRRRPAAHAGQPRRHRPAARRAGHQRVNHHRARGRSGAAGGDRGARADPRRQRARSHARARLRLRAGERVPGRDGG